MHLEATLVVGGSLIEEVARECHLVRILVIPSQGNPRTPAARDGITDSIDRQRAIAADIAVTRRYIGLIIIINADGKRIGRAESTADIGTLSRELTVLRSLSLRGHIYHLAVTIADECRIHGIGLSGYDERRIRIQYPNLLIEEVLVVTGYLHSTLQAAARRIGVSYNIEALQRNVVGHSHHRLFRDRRLVIEGTALDVSQNLGLQLNLHIGSKSAILYQEAVQGSLRNGERSDIRSQVTTCKCRCIVLALNAEFEHVTYRVLLRRRIDRIPRESQRLSGVLLRQDQLLARKNQLHIAICLRFVEPVVQTVRIFASREADNADEQH